MEDEDQNGDGSRPHKRQRLLACRRCRHRKQRCTDPRPCANCERAGEECIATDPLPRSGVNNSYVKALEDRVAELEALHPRHSSDHMPVASAERTGQSLDHSAVDAGDASSAARPPLSSASRAARGSIHSNPSDRPVSERRPSTAHTLDDHLDTVAVLISHAAQASPSLSHGLSPSQRHASAGRDNPRHPQHVLYDKEGEWLDAHRERAQAQYPFFHWPTLVAWICECRAAAASGDRVDEWKGFFANLVFSTALLLLSDAHSARADGRALYRAGIASLGAVMRHQDPVVHIQAYLLLSMHFLYQSSTQHLISLVSSTMRYCVQNHFHLARAEPSPSDAKARMEIQLRRRCFWSAYALDRMTTAAFDLPPSVPDAMITTPLYANVDDEELEAVATRQPPGSDIPDSPSYTGVSSSLHILQVRRIQSEISLYTLRWDYSLAYEKSSEWRIRILGELQNHKSRVQAFSDPRSSGGQTNMGHTAPRWLAMIYHYTLLMLYRPTKGAVLGPAGDWSVQASSQACLTFRAFQKDRTVAQAWLALPHQFQAGITLLYCFWATPPECRTENYDSPDMSDAVRACSNILAILSDRWPKADCLRDVFELLAREVPLIDRPGRRPTRVSSRAEASIRAMLPDLRSLVVHHPTLRMIEEMISDEFPTFTHSNGSATVLDMGSTEQRSQAEHAGLEQGSYSTMFDMPFSGQDPVFHDVTHGDISQMVGAEDIPEFPGVLFAL